MSNLEIYRRKAGYTQKALAEAAGLSQPMIGFLERGPSKTNLDNARAIVSALNAKGLNITVDDVFPPKAKNEEEAA